MSGTLGPAKSWRVVYNDELLVTFFEETDGMLYTGQTCFEFSTKEECLVEMRNRNLKFEHWISWFYPDDSCSAPLNRSDYRPAQIIEIGVESDQYGKIISNTKEDCLDVIFSRNLHIK
jgi:hypothetical protein